MSEFNTVVALMFLAFFSILAFLALHDALLCEHHIPAAIHHHEAASVLTIWVRTAAHTSILSWAES